MLRLRFERGPRRVAAINAVICRRKPVPELEPTKREKLPDVGQLLTSAQLYVSADQMTGFIAVI